MKRGFHLLLACLLAGVLLLVGFPALASSVDYDILITNGTVVDGTGGTGYEADVGIRGSTIVDVGDLSTASAKRVIDATGLVVAPGFIDNHTNSGTGLLKNPECLSMIYQGVTTLIMGEQSSAPRAYDPEGAFVSLGGFYKLLKDNGISCNYGSYVDQQNVRRIVLGYEDRRPTEAELGVMKTLVAGAMEDGAFGLSSALIYTPGAFSSTETVIELAKVAAKYGGSYKSHVRGEDIYQLEPGKGHREFVDICKAANLPGVICHFKAPGVEYYEQHMMQQTIDMVDEARAQGYDITAEMYPYRFGATGLSAIIPPWEHEGGREAMLARLEDPVQRAIIRQEIYQEIETPYFYNFVMDVCGKDFSNLGFISSPTGKNTDLLGKFFDEIALIRGYTDPDDAIEAVFDIIIEENGGGALIAPAYFDMSDLELTMSQPWVAIASDGSAMDPAWGGMGHPRSYGTFPKVLAKFVREKGLLTLEEAVYKMTWLPAQEVGITDRGKVEVGMAADITLFDPDTVQDKATYVDPLQYPEGIPYVIVNGVVVIDEGEHTGALPGKILRFNEMPEVPPSAPTSNVGLTVDIPTEWIVAISVEPTEIDFGTLYPGQTSDPVALTLENIGERAVDVDALLVPSGTVFENLTLDDDAYSSWQLEDLAVEASDEFDAVLQVPPTYTPRGEEEATLIFEATAS